MKTILFACVHNAGRSQMAAAWFNALCDPKAAWAISAGTQPADQVHPPVITAMKEAGIDLSSARPQLLTEELAHSANLLVTMGCEETCPVIPGLEREDWPLADPKGQSLEAVRAIRDEIQQRVTAVLAERGWGRK
jgi:arsenate reductase